MSLVIRITSSLFSHLLASPRPPSFKGTLRSGFLFYFPVSSWAMCLKQISCKIKQASPPFIFFFQGVVGEKVAREITINECGPGLSEQEKAARWRVPWHWRVSAGQLPLGVPFARSGCTRSSSLAEAFPPQFLIFTDIHQMTSPLKCVFILPSSCGLNVVGHTFRIFKNATAIVTAIHQFKKAGSLQNCVWS